MANFKNHKSMKRLPRFKSQTRAPETPVLAQRAMAKRPQRILEKVETQISNTRKYNYGWRPSLPDHRDFKADTSGITIAPEVDPRSNMPKIQDQGALGSCTANAVAAAIEYDRILDYKDYGAPSRLFLYYGERFLERTLSQGDCGAHGRDGFKFAQKYGVLPEKDYPYKINNFNHTPTQKTWDEAAKYKLTKPYKSVPRTMADIKKVLSNLQTLALGFTVYESFESEQVAETGIMPMPGADEQILGGHEVLVVGYLKSHPNHVLVRNSWGTGWGLHGYFLMPWQIILDKSYSSDFRTIVRSL